MKNGSLTGKSGGLARMLLAVDLQHNKYAYFPKYQSITVMTYCYVFKGSPVFP